jgi:hypothetical protein
VAKPKGLGLMIAIGKSKADDGEDAPESDKDLPESDFESLAGDVFDALKEDDRKGFAAALKSAIHACSDEYSDEE